MKRSKLNGNVVVKVSQSAYNSLIENGNEVVRYAKFKPWYTGPVIVVSPLEEKGKYRVGFGVLTIIDYSAPGKWAWNVSKFEHKSNEFIRRCPASPICSSSKCSWFPIGTTRIEFRDYKDRLISSGQVPGIEKAKKIIKEKYKEEKENLNRIHEESNQRHDHIDMIMRDNKVRPVCEMKGIITAKEASVEVNSEQFEKACKKASQEVDEFRQHIKRIENPWYKRLMFWK